MKIALVHDYLTQRGGAERVFELLCKKFPQADIITSIYDKKNTIDLGNREIKTTILQKVPYGGKNFRLLAPFYFPAFRALNLEKYDLIISSSSSFAKAVRKRPDAKHICFCHNITRFLWDTDSYLRQYSSFKPLIPLIKPVFKQMRNVDLKYSQEPDIYIANSTTVAQRIEKYYGKKALVINYPIDSNQFIYLNNKDDYYFVSSRLMSYKRIDIIIEAFNWLGWPLLIAGDGPELNKLKEKALDNIKFLGYVSDLRRRYYMASARGVIVAGLEDYGLVPIEANISGTPVIAFGAGGVLDTQIPGKTGVFFKRQTPEAIHNALLEANSIAWDYETIREHAFNNFTEEAFFQQVENVMKRSGIFNAQVA